MCRLGPVGWAGRCRRSAACTLGLAGTAPAGVSTSWDRLTHRLALAPTPLQGMDTYINSITERAHWLAAEDMGAVTVAHPLLRWIQARARAGAGTDRLPGCSQGQGRQRPPRPPWRPPARTPCAGDQHPRRRQHARKKRRDLPIYFERARWLKHGLRCRCTALQLGPSAALPCEWCGGYTLLVFPALVPNPLRPPPSPPATQFTYTKILQAVVLACGIVGSLAFLWLVARVRVCWLWLWLGVRPAAAGVGCVMMHPPTPHTPARPSPSNPHLQPYFAVTLAESRKVAELLSYIPQLDTAALMQAAAGGGADAGGGLTRTSSQASEQSDA